MAIEKEIEEREKEIEARKKRPKQQKARLSSLPGKKLHFPFF